MKWVYDPVPPPPPILTLEHSKIFVQLEFKHFLRSTEGTPCSCWISMNQYCCRFRPRLGLFISFDLKLCNGYNAHTFHRSSCTLQINELPQISFSNINMLFLLFTLYDQTKQSDNWIDLSFMQILAWLNLTTDTFKANAKKNYHKILYYKMNASLIFIETLVYFNIHKLCIISNVFFFKDTMYNWVDNK
jgi:hypothetical protein